MTALIRAGLFKAMEEFHVPRKLSFLVELTLETVRCKVKTFNGTIESFEAKKRLGEKPYCAFCLI
jgi:hypothetical protein